MGGRDLKKRRNLVAGAFLILKNGKILVECVFLILKLSSKRVSIAF